MPLRRPLPDLCLISVFKMLTPNEQLVASEMSLRCAVLVRAANRTVKMLVISEDYGEEYRFSPKNRIDSFSFASKPSMQQLLDIPGETFPDYPMTTCLSKWNILRLEQLRQLDTATIKQIVTIFSAVTELKFFTSNNKHIETLVSLLQHPNWQCQLINLMVDGTRWAVSETFEIDSQLAGELITAINGLTALQLLALDWNKHAKVPDLSILAQLKTVVFKCYFNSSSFLRSLKRNAIDNADLEVHLLSDDTMALLTLSPPLHSRIVRFGLCKLSYTRDQVPLLCSQFRSLTSLSLYTIKSTKVEQLFSDLSQLHQLIHLNFGVDFGRVKKKLPLLPARSLAQLNSLRALELHLSITSHSQIEWLNLPWTMPNLKIIYIWEFNCDNCKVEFGGLRGDSSLLSSSPTLGCFRSSLFNLHPDVPLKQIILFSIEGLHTAEELLLQSQ